MGSPVKKSQVAVGIEARNLILGVKAGNKVLIEVEREAPIY